MNTPLSRAAAAASTLSAATRFVIAAYDEDEGLLFWNNDAGFGDLSSATTYTGAEAAAVDLPLADTITEWLALPRDHSLTPESEPHFIKTNSTTFRQTRKNRARTHLLDQLHELMATYLLDQCPDDEFYENFDPGIDRLCSEIDDLRNTEAAHLANLPAQPLEFLLDIAFLSGGDHFATETYSIEAFDWMDAKRIAFQLAADSPYDNDRIPCLERRAIDRTPGPTSLEAAPSLGYRRSHGTWTPSCASVSGTMR